MYRNVLIVLVTVVLLVNAIALAPALPDNKEIEIVGCHIKDYMAVNGTIVIGLLLRSDVVISGVVVSYVNRYEKQVKATMNLIEGDANEGWWEATITPKLMTETANSETRYRIDTMQLFVFLPSGVIELAIPQSLLSSWSTEKEQVTLASPVATISLLILVVSCIGITLALKQNHRERKIEQGISEVTTPPLRRDKRN
jgi:hypothetical protein